MLRLVVAAAVVLAIGTTTAEAQSMRARTDAGSSKQAWEYRPIRENDRPPLALDHACRTLPGFVRDNRWKCAKVLRWYELYGRK